MEEKVLPREQDAQWDLSLADARAWRVLNPEKNVTHIPRPEEWPVMPTTRIGFKLLPSGFFEANPALDVPR
jgi:Cu2+-containing amine oxidase